MKKSMSDFEHISLYFEIFNVGFVFLWGSSFRKKFEE